MSSPRAEAILAGLEARTTGDSAAQSLVDGCRDALRVSGAGLTLVTAARPSGILAATGGTAKTLEDLQFSLGEGPCTDSCLTRRPVLHDDLARSGPEQWPAFAMGALAAGVRAAFAFPLVVDLATVGVLDLYHDRTGALSPADLAEAGDYASAATSVVLRLMAHVPAEGDDTGLPELLGNRAVVHQASGMVSVQAQVSVATGLLLLRTRAFVLDRPVVAVAEDVVERRLRFTPSDGGK